MKGHNNLRLGLLWLCVLLARSWSWINPRSFPCRGAAADHRGALRSTDTMVGSRGQAGGPCTTQSADEEHSRKGLRRRLTSQSFELIEFNDALEALRLYHEQYGDLCMKSSWRVPSTYPWPERFRGRWLARIVYKREFWLKFVSGHEDRREALDRLGYVWGRLQPPYNLFLEALVSYKMIKGHLDVPIRFVVPKEGPWPQSVWGLPLGLRVYCVRHKNQYLAKHPERHHQLQDMGFFFSGDQKFELVLEALKIFHRLNGHANVKCEYVIPETEDFPKHLHGLPLGVRLEKIRSRNYYNVKSSPEKLRALAALGWQCKLKWVGDFERAMSAAQVYRTLFGERRIPRLFCVPASLPWPEQSWGMRLGEYIYKQTMTGHAFAGRPDLLDKFESLGLLYEKRAKKFEAHNGMSLRVFAQTSPPRKTG